MTEFERPDRNSHLEILLECAGIGMWEMTFDGPSVITHLDERTSVLWGFPREERTLEYTELLSLYHKDDLPRTQETLQYVMEHPGTSRMIEYRIWNEAEKGWRWSRSFGTCRDSKTPGVYHIIGITINFHDSPVIQSLIEQTQEANERTQIMLDELPLCCNYWLEDYTIIDCNEGSVKMFQMKSKKEYLEKYYDLMPEFQPCGRRSRELAAELTITAFNKGRIVFEWMYQRLDGVLIPSEVTLVRVKYGDRYIVVEYTRDLREHKKMMQEIEYRDALLHMENNVASILLRSNIERFNDDLQTCFGILAKNVEADRVYIWKNSVVDGQLCCSQVYEWSESVNPMQGADITVNIPYSAFFEGSSSLEDTLSSGQCVNDIVCNMQPALQAQLKIRAIKSILMIPLFLREQFWGVIGFDNCHSERRFTVMEEKMLRSAGMLITYALLKNEMTLDIQAAEKEAKAASMAKSNFLSNMSHELRTPMNAIIGMTTIGKAAANVERKDYAFSKIENASRHMLGVINDILDMSKIEANKFELSVTAYNLENVINQVINVVSHRIDEKKQRLSTRIDNTIPKALTGDDQRLAQVIANLLSNAIKFTPEQGSINIDAKLLDTADGLNTIQVAISDTGIGISVEHIDTLFDAFQQADNNTTRKFGGTGLGLAISKNIIEMMGGTIQAESEPGKGSVFTFTIKAKSSDGRSAEINGSHETGAPAAGDAAGTLKGYRILLVDDIDINREIVIDLLESTGVAIECAENGEEAVRLFKESEDAFDLILMDAQMPVMDGYNATRIIRAMTGNPHASQVPIIAMTADVFQEDIERCLNAGMNDHIGKPLDVDVLFSKIYAFIRACL